MIVYFNLFSKKNVTEFYSLGQNYLITSLEGSTPYWDDRFMGDFLETKTMQVLTKNTYYMMN